MNRAGLALLMRPLPLILVICSVAAPAGAEWLFTSSKTDPPTFVVSADSNPPGLHLGFSCSEKRPKRTASLGTWTWTLPDSEPIVAQVTTLRGTRTVTFARTGDQIPSWAAAADEAAALATWLEEKADNGVTIRWKDKSGKSYAARFADDPSFDLYTLRGNCGG